MTRIGLMSDTHGFLDPHIFTYFSHCDEVWHAGDLGSEIAERMEEFKIFRAVHGNIDTPELSRKYPLDQRFELEGMDVWITHIGGYPGKYTKRVLETMKINPPGLFVCGHSHILKVIYDQKYQCLHMNPGACGHEGFHFMRTLLRFQIEEGVIKNLEIVELGRRGRL